MSPEAVRWRIANGVGILQCGPLAATAKCDRDGVALIPTSWNGQPVHGSEVLAAAGRSELEMVELYVRGADLVANFSPTGPDRLSPQIYWRATDLSGIARVELILSISTELLDSTPAWCVRSSLANATLLYTSSLEHRAFSDVGPSARDFSRSAAGEHLFMFRDASRGLSYAEMVHPSDFVAATASGQESPSVVSQLFPDRLEKGVIRRGRVCGWFLPSENDQTRALELARQFVNEPLPLTA